MIEIELDGKKVEVTEGCMVMHAAEKAGTYIPHFCYHKKLSIAANCRMCLVDVEKAPKPMPACATPVTPGMVVRTKSDKALKAQQSVMEFLLINHPLDCPICDQGGECQLQDLAVGYGGSSSRYGEEKRVVFHKDVGPLISMEEMSRCIHCTRCVRFGQEIAGDMELGMIHRGEHSEITTIKGETVDSELSGNMIDVCPVGALTSKPFRYSARTWELSRRKSVSPHDSLGANLIVQVKNQKVLRVVPLENEDVNECWIADRDRFSYEALNTEDRLTSPQIKQGGQWQTVSWTQALEYVASGLKGVVDQHGSAAVAALAGPGSTLEELHLLAQVVRGLGSENIDHRLRHTDFANVAPAADGAPAARWLGMPLRELSSLDRVLVVGSALRKDHPLMAQRIRQASRRGAKVYRLDAALEDWAMPVAGSVLSRPSQWLAALAEIAAVVAQAQGIAAPVPVAPVGAREAAQEVARGLLSGERKAIFLGMAAARHPQASALLALAQWIGERVGARVGYFGDGASAVAAALVGAEPKGAGLHAAQMLSPASGVKAVLLFQVEAALDVADPVAAQAALNGAEMVVAFTPFRSAAPEEADVILPIAPFTETSGSFINAEGRVQSFHGVVKPLGDTRPGWKVLRVLGNVLGLSGFDFETSESVRDAALGDQPLAERLSNRPAEVDLAAALAACASAAGEAGLECLSTVPIYATDAVVRRAGSLQRTLDGQAALTVGVSEALAQQLGLQGQGELLLSAGEQSLRVQARVEPLAEGVIRLPAGVQAFASLGAAQSGLSLKKA
jgi:NADH-quinone oxidoreductase subunit G